jgi:hypothetical protein
MTAKLICKNNCSNCSANCFPRGRNMYD